MKIEDWDRFSSLLFNDNYSEAEKLVRDEPSLITGTNGIGETVLHYHAVENNRKGVEWLYSHGADLNAKNEFGIPVVFEVALLGYRSLLDWMVKNGADLFAMSKEGGIQDYLEEYNALEMIQYVKNKMAEQGCAGNVD